MVASPSSKTEADHLCSREAEILKMLPICILRTVGEHLPARGGCRIPACLYKMLGL